MTDKEALEALQLTKEDLLRMASEGERARVARKVPRRLRKSATGSGGFTDSVVIDHVERSVGPVKAVAVGRVKGLVIHDTPLSSEAAARR